MRFMWLIYVYEYYMLFHKTNTYSQPTVNGSKDLYQSKPFDGASWPVHPLQASLADKPNGRDYGI